VPRDSSKGPDRGSWEAAGSSWGPNISSWGVRSSYGRPVSISSRPGCSSWTADSNSRTPDRSGYGPVSSCQGQRGSCSRGPTSSWCPKASSSGSWDPRAACCKRCAATRGEWQETGVHEHGWRVQGDAFAQERQRFVIGRIRFGNVRGYVRTRFRASTDHGSHKTGGQEGAESSCCSSSTRRSSCENCNSAS
jgi:hypothetical protein